MCFIIPKGLRAERRELQGNSFLITDYNLLGAWNERIGMLEIYHLERIDSLIGNFATHIKLFRLPPPIKAHFELQPES